MRNLLERSDITKRREESVLCIRTPSLYKRSLEGWGYRRETEGLPL